MNQKQIFHQIVLEIIDQLQICTKTDLWKILKHEHTTTLTINEKTQIMEDVLCGCAIEITEAHYQIRQVHPLEQTMTERKSNHLSYRNV